MVFKHKDPGTTLTQDEFITTDGTGHVFASQATGDILYASSTTVLTRLGKGADGTVLELASGLPAWTASPTIGATSWANAGHAHAASNSGGQIATSGLAADAVTEAKIADDAINSEHYTDASIDTAHIANLQITTALIANDAVTAAKIPDDAINSEHYTDGSIDTAHIADNQVTVAKIEDIARGSIIVGNASAATAELTKGSAATVLTSDGTDIAWAAPAAAGVSVGLAIALS
jgi:hypothetical protein